MDIVQTVKQKVSSHVFIHRATVVTYLASIIIISQVIDVPEDCDFITFKGDNYIYRVLELSMPSFIALLKKFIGQPAELQEILKLGLHRLNTSIRQIGDDFGLDKTVLLQALNFKDPKTVSRPT